MSIISTSITDIDENWISAVNTSLIYITGGPNPYEGRIEVYVDGERGLVCDDYWNDVAANIACQEMGFAGNMEKLLWFNQDVA